MGKKKETTVWFEEPVKIETDGSNVKITGVPIENDMQNMEDFSFEGKVNRLKEYIEDTIGILNVDLPDEYYYSCLPLCLLDAIYSIGVKYTSTQNVVEKYCNEVGIPKLRDKDKPLDGEENKALDDAHTIKDLISEIGKNKKEISDFAEYIVKNKQLTSSRSGILKAEAVLQCAYILEKAKVQTIHDFNSIILKEDDFSKSIEDKFRDVQGQSSGISFSYLKMLCGDEKEFKADRHILRFLSRALGYEVGKEEAEKLIPAVERELRDQNPNLTVRSLDYAIWNKMRSET